MKERLWQIVKESLTIFGALAIGLLLLWVLHAGLGL